MTLSQKRYKVRRNTRLSAGMVGLVYGILYFFPALRNTDYWFYRHFLVLVIGLIAFLGWWIDRQLVEQDKKRKRDSLPMN